MFCITGKAGVVRSTDGGTWSRVSTAPNNIGLLNYISTRGIFFGVNLTSKCVVASSDGKEWTEYSGVIPLDTINDICYSPEYGWFCAVGNDNKAYFSSDLRRWRSVDVAPEGVTLTRIDWSPAQDLFMVMPSTGSVCYVFSPSEWRDITASTTDGDDGSYGDTGDDGWEIIDDTLTDGE